MAIPWGLVVIAVGFAFGALNRGRQDKGRILAQGLLVGIILAMLLVVLGSMVGVPVLQIAGVAGAIGVVLTTFVLSLLFILGVWIGDLVTGSKRRR